MYFSLCDKEPDIKYPPESSTGESELDSMQSSSPSSAPMPINTVSSAVSRPQQSKYQSIVMMFGANVCKVLCSLNYWTTFRSWLFKAPGFSAIMQKHQNSQFWGSYHHAFLDPSQIFAILIKHYFIVNSLINNHELIRNSLLWHIIWNRYDLRSFQKL